MPRWLRFPRQSDELEPVVFRHLRDDPQGRPWNFISLRWQAVVPLALAVLLIGMLGAYLVADAIARESTASSAAQVRDASRAAAARMRAISDEQQREVMRIAYTDGVAAAVQTRDRAALHRLLEPLAAAADLDYVLVADANGRELVGLQRVATAGGTLDYAVASGTDLAALLAAVPAQGGAGTAMQAVFARTGQDHALLTAGPVLAGDQRAGTVFAGVQAGRLLEMLQGGDGTGIALFGAGGEFVRTTLPFDDSTRGALAITPAIYEQVLSTPGTVSVERVTVGDQPCQVAYIPLVVGGTPLGVTGIYLPDTQLATAGASRDTLGLLSAALTGMVIVLGFVVAGRFSRRVERVTQTAHALASGDARARTGMHARDEIGELGATLDRYAARQQRRADRLQQTLRRQRADSARLTAVLESIPDGIVVQDLDGRVLLINDAARELLGGQRVFRAARLHDLTAVVTETLGPALAPGVYALGNPARVPLEGKMLQAQAAAIVLKSKQRVGTVIVLRDITGEVQREQTREALLDRLAQEATVPTGRQAESLSSLAREFVRNTRAIQRIITDLRDLSTFDRSDLDAGQRALPVNELVWNVAAEWEPLARAAKSRLHVSFGPRGNYVLGDDRRLRWAIGNLIDNALKYSPPHTVIRLSAEADYLPGDDPDHAVITITDEGSGITPEDLPNVFTRFYRGTPCDPDGKPIRKPGTGQGLYIARRVIEAHGGTIALESRAGIGTVATVRLPLTASVALPVPGEPNADRTKQDDSPELSHGEFDTVPLEPRRYPWEKGDKPE